MENNNSNKGRIIIAGEPTPNPDAKIVTPGPIPNPDANIVIAGEPVPNPEANVIIAGEPTPNPDAKIVIAGEPVPNPEAKVVIAGEPVPNPDAEVVLTDGPVTSPAPLGMSSIEDVINGELNYGESIKKQKDFLELLNSARQKNVEHEDVYQHVFGKGAASGIKYPSSLINRPDLLQKFAVGKNGEPFNNTRDAARELVDFLAKEAENRIERIKRNEGGINSQKDLLELLNKARQGNVEHEDVYWHVFGKGAASGIKYPSSLINRPDLLQKFSVGKNGEPFDNTRDAARALVDFLAEEAEGKIKELVTETTAEPGTKEKPKTPEEIEARRRFIIFIRSIMEGDVTAIENLYVFITNINVWKIEWLTQEEIEFQQKLLILLLQFRAGNTTIINDIKILITNQTIWNITNITNITNTSTTTTVVNPPPIPPGTGPTPTGDGPQPDPPPPGDGPKPPHIPQPDLKKPERLTFVNAQAQVELLSKERGMRLLNEKLNRGNFLKRWWTRMWEPGYRQQLIAEERKKILGEENKPGWFRRTLFGAQTLTNKDEKNLFAGTGEEAQSDPELAALVERFAGDYKRSSEGELKNQLNDPEFSTKINDLIHQYAVSGMSDADFRAKKDALVEKMAEKYPDVLEQDGLTADNMLEAAVNFRKIYEFNKKLDRMDVQLEIDLGLAKQAVKTEANLTWVDRAVSFSQKHFGPAVSPEAIGFGVSIASYFARKPLYWLGGAAGLGGLMGAMRKNVEQKRDLEMHRTERAMGTKIDEFGPDAKRRKNAERFLYSMKEAPVIIGEINNLLAAFNTSPTPANAEALTKVLADTEARQTLSETKEKDWISYKGKTALERNRLELIKTLRIATVALGTGGFESDMKKTSHFNDSMNSLVADMDQIDSSERWHRWGENAKAGAIGAIGGAVVGGLVQQGMAFVGDHIPSLHSLRPGGKATSLESLYHYVTGETAPGSPSGNNLQDVFGMNIQNGESVLKVDGSMKLIKDPATGLFNLVDKVDHHKILAQFNFDPSTGHHTIVKGSYDPNIIGFHQSQNVVKGHSWSFSEWYNSVKGHLGGNVKTETWHTEDFLANNTPMPKTEFNELRFYASYDGQNVKLDTSKLLEFATNASGEQISGSTQGGHVLNVAEAFAKGELKIGLIPDNNHPTEVLNLIFDPVKKTFVSEDGSSISQFFVPDPKTGAPVLRGNSLMGVVHVLGTREDGSSNVEWVNAIKGVGDAGRGSTPDITKISTELTRNEPKEWWGPWMWWFRRKPLEEKKDKGQGDQGIIGPDDQGKKDGEKKGGPEKATIKKKIPGYKVSFYEEPKDPNEKIKGKKIKTEGGVQIGTRGQEIESIDDKDFVESYPEKFPLKDEKEMAQYLIGSKTFFSKSEDEITKAKMEKMSPEERVEYLAKKILNEREALGSEFGLNQKRISEITDIVFKQVDEVLDMYGKEGRSKLPAKDKIHVVGLLEYQAQAGISSVGALGICFSNSGEIFINLDAIIQGCKNDEEVIPQLKRTIAHELMHDAGVNNYWMFQMDSNDEVAVARRSGLKMSRKQNMAGGGQLIVERGRGLNEAVIEAISEDITKRIYAGENASMPKLSMEPYSSERTVLGLLQKKFNIPFEVFAKAIVNRGNLRELAEKIDGKEQGKDIERPQFMSLFMSIMDFEFNKKSNNYVKTKQLINGVKGVLISKEMKSTFPKSLLDENGDIKESLVTKYNLIDKEAIDRAKLPKAA